MLQAVVITSMASILYHKSNNFRPRKSDYSSECSDTCTADKGSFCLGKVGDSLALDPAVKSFQETGFLDDAFLTKTSQERRENDQDGVPEVQ